MRRLIILCATALCLIAVQVAFGATFIRSWGSCGPGVGCLRKPTGIAVDPRGDLYVIDKYWQVLKYSATGTYLGAIGGRAGDAGVSGPGFSSRPAAIAIDPRGYLYVVAPNPNLTNFIQKFDLDGTYIRSFGGGRLLQPRGIAVDPHGNVLVTDSGIYDYANRAPSLIHRVDLYHADGQFIRTFGQSALGEPWGVTTDGVAVCSDCSYHIYVTDPATGQVVVFNTDGQVVGRWGGVGYRPVSVAVAPHGHVFVRTGGGGVTVLDRSGQILSKFVLPNDPAPSTGVVDPYQAEGLALILRHGAFGSVHLHAYMPDFTANKVLEYVFP